MYYHTLHIVETIVGHQDYCITTLLPSAPMHSPSSPAMCDGEIYPNPYEFQGQKTTSLQSCFFYCQTLPKQFPNSTLNRAITLMFAFF